MQDAEQNSTNGCRRWMIRDDPWDAEFNGRSHRPGRGQCPVNAVGAERIRHRAKSGSGEIDGNVLQWPVRRRVADGAAGFAANRRPHADVLRARLVHRRDYGNGKKDRDVRKKPYGTRTTLACARSRNRSLSVDGPEPRTNGPRVRVSGRCEPERQFRRFDWTQTPLIVGERPLIGRNGPFNSLYRQIHQRAHRVTLWESPDAPHTELF